MSSSADRIASMKDELTVLVKQHELDTFPEGAEALSAKVEDILDRANLMENRTCNVDRLGVFPGNRETAMLIPVEVQHLLHESLPKNGWNASKWNCMALTVPDSLRDEWAKANNDLVLRAQGHLPAIHDMELATGRGSHGTAALRSVMFSCKSIYIDIADSNGNISMAKCLERQPSLRAPLEDGVFVKVIPGELELAVQGLFQLLSRTGNVSNSSYRIQTTLQSCCRLHQLAVQYEDAQDANWDKIELQASIGMAPEDARNVSKLRAFVTQWSGGRRSCAPRPSEL